jgi:hypothetical protein
MEVDVCGEWEEETELKAEEIIAALVFRNRQRREVLVEVGVDGR